MAQQRMQQNVSGANAAAPMGLADGNARMTGQSGGSSAGENHTPQGAQSGGGVGSQDGNSSQIQEPERPDGNMPSGNDQSLHQGSSGNDGGQAALRRNSALSLVASAASAFDAAKDIMEALRSKHSNLAGELEVGN